MMALLLLVVSEVLVILVNFVFEVVCQSLVLELACIYFGIVLVVELCLDTLYPFV